MSDDVRATRAAAEMRRSLASKVEELDNLTSGRTIILYESELAGPQKALDEEIARRAESRRQFEAQLKPLDDAHTFRRALIADPAAVEFVRGDLEWLRLVLLMYSGLADTHLVSYSTQYSEIATVLQMDNVTREAAVNQLRKKLYWRPKWDGDNVIYNLAGYLDTECGRGSKAAARASLLFDPVSICLDSVLSPTLLSWLQARVPGKSMLDLLLEVARCPDDPLRSASALLALLAADPTSAFDELVRLCRDGARREVARAFRDLIQQRLGMMRDGTVLYSVTKKLEAEMAHLSTTLPSEQFEGVLSVFYRALCEALPAPPPIESLISRMDLPYANAELWATWLSGALGDDPKYNFAVVLDTIGKRIHSVDALANLHRAHATRFQQFTTWTLDPIPPVWESLPDMCGEAFTIAQESSSLILVELFHAGAILYSGAKFQDAPDLLTDALATALMLPIKSFEVVLPELSKKLSQQSGYEIERTVIERARAIDDPVIRARVLWRVGRHLLRWGEVKLFAEAIAAAATLTDPLQRARAFERLFKDAPAAMRPPLLQQMREAAHLILDANNRVRALCRLAILSSRDETARLCREAVALLGSIKSNADRVETLVLMRKVFADHHLPQDDLDEVAETEADPWYRHKGMGLLSFELVKVHPSMRHPAEAAPVILHAVLLDALALLDRTEGFDQSWSQLTRHESRDDAFAALLADIARSDAGTIPFTRATHASLAALPADGAALAIALLPHLVLPRSQGVFPELHDWLQHPPHECYRPYAGLMLAESGQLDASNLPQVLELLRSGKDIARYRAALVLHSDNVGIGKPDPHHRASVLGLEGILRISEFALRMTEQGRSGPAGAARWTWQNTVFDSPEILEGLVRCIHEDPQRRKAAARVIPNLYILTDASQEKFVELLLNNRSSPAAVPLLQGLCTLFDKDLKFTVPEKYQADVASYWNALSGELADALRGLPDRIESVRSVLLKSDADSLSPAALDAALRGRFLTPMKSSPQEIGQCSVYWPGKDPGNALAAAKAIADSPPRLRAFFVWLRACLAESIVDPSRLIRKRDTLLEIAGYCGQHSPATVFNLIEELDLEDLLVKAVVHQRWHNGRAGAVSLLGYIRNPGRGFLTALKSAMADTAAVQQAALGMAHRLRYVNPAILTDLIELLKDEDTTLVYTASRLLAVIARNEKTGNADRKSISRALSSALKDRSARHVVCAFEMAGNRMWISKLGTLAQRHYQSLMEIVSMS